MYISFLKYNMTAHVPTITKYRVSTMAMEWVLNGYWMAIESWLGARERYNPNANRLRCSNLRVSLTTIAYTRQRLMATVRSEAITSRSIYWNIRANGLVYLNLQSGQPLHPLTAHNALASNAALQELLGEEWFWQWASINQNKNAFCFCWQGTSSP